MSPIFFSPGFRSLPSPASFPFLIYGSHVPCAVRARLCCVFCMCIQCPETTLFFWTLFLVIGSLSSSTHFPCNGAKTLHFTTHFVSPSRHFTRNAGSSPRGVSLNYLGSEISILPSSQNLALGTTRLFLQKPCVFSIRISFLPTIPLRALQSHVHKLHRSETTT